MKQLTLLVLLSIILLPVAQAVNISGVSSSVSDTGAIISWTTDEDSGSIVRYGNEGITDAVSSEIETTLHEVAIDGLDPGTDYIYSVESGDVQDDNDGSYYTFTTGSLESTVEESDEEESIEEEPSSPESIELTVEHDTIVRGANLDITGTTYEGAEVRVFINENYVSMVDATDGTFSINSIPLAPNENNQLLVEAKVGDINEFYLSEVQSDTAHPEVTIGDIPSIIDEIPYVVAASSTEEVEWSFSINGDDREAEDGMTTELSLDLEEGENTIVVSATDSSGWVTSTTYLTYADTQPPTVEVEFEKGNEYYQNRAETNIYGETEPGSKVFLYVVQPTSYEQRPDFSEPWKTVEANSAGNFTFSDVNFESEPFDFDDITPTEVPAGLQEVTIAAMSDWQNADSYTYHVFVLAEDQSGKTGYVRETITVNSCYSSNFDFQITSLAQFQRPYKLNPSLLDEGREQATAVFNLTYIGSDDFSISGVNFEKACTDSMMEDPVFELGCNIFPNRIKFQSNTDKTAHYLELDLSSSEDLTKVNPDLWEEFKKRQIVFPMKVSVTYRSGEGDHSSTRTQSSCVDLGYFIDIPINSSDLIPDWLAINGMEFLNKTINTLDKIIPTVEKIAKYVAMACQVSIGLETVTRFTRNIVQNSEIIWNSGCGVLSAQKMVTQKEYDRITRSGDSALLEKVKSKFGGSFPEDSDPIFLDDKCPNTASLWEAEVQLVNLRRMVCDRALCREVPSGWTEGKTELEIGLKINEKARCGSASSCQRMTKIENCRSYIDDNRLGSTYRVDGTVDTYASCYYYETENMGGTIRPKELWIYSSTEALNDQGSKVVKLKNVGSSDIDTRNELVAYRDGGQDSLCVPPSISCNTKCRDYGRSKVTDGYTINEYTESVGGSCYKLTDSGYSGPSDTSGVETPSRGLINAGMTSDCFVSFQEGTGDSSLYSCYCEKAEPSAESETDLMFHYEYRFDSMSRNKLGTGIKYSSNLYYEGRDLTASFGQDRLSDMITGAEDHPTISPYGFIGSIQTICVSTILKNLLSIRSIVAGAQACLEEAKYTGFHDAGMCKTLFTQHVCGLVSKFVAAFTNKCGGLTIDDPESSGKLSKVGQTASVLGTSISDTISQSATELTSDYDNAYLNEYFSGGVEGVTQSMCLAAFGYDFPIGFDTAMDMVYSTATESTVLVMPATRQFSNYNPFEMTAVTNYEIAVAVVPGCPVQSYKTELVCVGAEDLANGADCSSVECPCLTTAGTTSFEADRRTTVEGGVGSTMESNKLIDLPIPSPLKLDKQFLYDHVKVTLTFDQYHNPEQCAPSGHVQGNNGVWYVPIRDLSAPDISCQFELGTGRYTCPGIGDMFSSGGNAYFMYPYMMCSDPLGAWSSCDDVRYDIGDKFAIKTTYHVDDSAYCLEYSVEGRGQTTSKQVARILPGVARDETLPIDLGEINSNMMGGSSASLERLASSTSPCPSTISGPSSGTQGGKDVSFVVTESSGRYGLTFNGEVSVVTDSKYNYQGNTLTVDGRTDFSSSDLQAASFIVDGITVDGVVPSQAITCGYRTRAQVSTSTSSSTANVKLKLLQADSRGECLNAQTQVPESGLGLSSVTQSITIGDPASGASGGVTSTLHNYFMSALGSKNFRNVYASAQPLIDEKDGMRGELIGLYYMLLSLMEDKQVNYVEDRMDQLFRLNSYSNSPAFDASVSIEEKKIKYYVCKKASTMTSPTVPLSSEGSSACQQRISEAEGGN